MKHCILEERMRDKEERKKYIWCKGYCARRKRTNCHLAGCPKFAPTIRYRLWRIFGKI